MGFTRVGSGLDIASGEVESEETVGLAGPSGDTFLLHQWDEWLNFRDGHQFVVGGHLLNIPKIGVLFSNALGKDKQMATQLPTQLLYSSGLKPASIPAQLYRQRMQPDSGTSFTNGSLIRIPINGNDFLDTRKTFLRAQLDVTIGTANASAYMQSIYSLIDRVRLVASDGKVLESIDTGYGALVNKFINLFMPRDTRVAECDSLALCRATGNSSQAVAWEDVLDSAPGVATANANWKKFNNGAVANNRVYVNMPIPFLGLMSLSSPGNAEHAEGLFVPLALTSGMFLEIYLRPNVVDSFVSPATGGGHTQAASISYTLTDVSLDAQMVSYGPTVTAQIRDTIARAGGKMYVSTSTYNVIQQSFSTGNFQATITQRCKSLQGVALWTALNDARNAIAPSFDASFWDGVGQSADVPGTVESYLLLAGVPYPAQRLQSVSDTKSALEAFAGKPLRGKGALTQNFTPWETSAVNIATATPTLDGAGALGETMFGIDLSSSAAQSWLEQGYKADSGNTQIQYYIGQNSPIANGKTAYIVTHYDLIYEFDVVNRTVNVMF